MNLKQFNFYSTRRVNCLLVEKRQPGLGSQNASKKEEKKRKKEKREADILCDTSAHEQKCSFAASNESSSRRRSETKFYRERERNLFYSFTTQKRGKGRQKRARVFVSFSLFREREERDSFVVVVSLTSFTSSSPGHHP